MTFYSSVFIRGMLISHSAWFCSFPFSSGPNIKSKELKRKEDLSLKPRSPAGAKSVTSSRFTVSPANDPHLVWCFIAWETFRAEPSWTGQWINHNNQPFTQRLFFYWRGNSKNGSRSKSWTHSRFYQRQDFVWQWLLCSCLPLFTERIHSLQLQKSLEEAAYATRGARSFVDSYAVGSCCVPANLLFFFFISLCYSPDVRGMPFLWSLI